MLIGYLFSGCNDDPATVKEPEKLEPLSPHDAIMKNIKKLEFFEQSGEPFLLSIPTGIQFLNDKYYIVDDKKGIINFDKNGRYIGVVYSLGQGPKEIHNFTFSMAQIGSQLWVHDWGNTRIHIYNTDNGEYSIIKSSKISLYTNIISINNQICMGAGNGFFLIDPQSPPDDKNFKKIEFTLPDDYKSSFMVTTRKGKLFAVGKAVHKKNRLVFFEQVEGDRYALHARRFEINDDLKNFLTDIRYNMFFTIFNYRDRIYLNIFKSNTENGALIFVINPDNTVSTFYIKDYVAVCFSESGPKRYVLPIVEGEIFELKN